MPADSACPPASVLRRFALGRMDEAEIIVVQRHLSQCPRCLEAVRQLNAEDTLTKALRQAPAKMSATEREQAARLIEQLRGPVKPPPEMPERLGPYQLRRVLGAGGMGTVYEAFDPKLRRPVALKVLKPELAAQPRFRERFLREGQAVAALRHEHIVTVYQVGEDRGTLFLAMEFLEGESLEARLQREPPLKLAEILAIGRAIAEGLAAAHAAGLIHRDIKPANIWLETLPTNSDGRPGRRRVRILDFGLALAAEGTSRLTKLHELVGTPAYMSPEQAEGRPVDARSDLFSLGGVLYRMCCGQPAFAGTNPMKVLHAVARQAPRPVDEVNPQLPRSLAGLVMQLLEKDPERRPPSADAVAGKLHALKVQRGKTSLAGRGRARPTQLAENELERLAVEEIHNTPVPPPPAAAPAPAVEPAAKVASQEDRPDRLSRWLCVAGIVALQILAISCVLPWYSYTPKKVTPGAGLDIMGWLQQDAVRHTNSYVEEKSRLLASVSRVILFGSASVVILVVSSLIASESKPRRQASAMLAGFGCVAVAWAAVAFGCCLAMMVFCGEMGRKMRSDAYVNMGWIYYRADEVVAPGAGLRLGLFAAAGVAVLFGSAILSQGYRRLWLLVSVGGGILIGMSVCACVSCIGSLTLLVGPNPGVQP
jgi:serine/threonine protein kinase